MNANLDSEFGDLLGSPRPVLTMQQSNFVTEFVKTGNASQAAAAAGYSRPRMPIARAVRQTIAETMEECGVTVKRTVSEVAKLAFYDIRKLFNEDGKLIELHKLDDETAAAVLSFEVAESSDKNFSEVSKIKMTPKLAALEHVSKLLQMTTERVEMLGPGGGPIQVEVGPNENVRRVAFLLEQAVRQMSNTAGSRPTALAQTHGSNRQEN
jgi:phage terminase small subunit